MQKLIENGTGVDEGCADRHTPLTLPEWLSVHCKGVLEAQANVNKATVNGYTPALVASHNGHEAIVEILVNADLVWIISQTEVKPH